MTYIQLVTLHLATVLPSLKNSYMMRVKLDCSIYRELKSNRLFGMVSRYVF